VVLGKKFLGQKLDLGHKNGKHELVFGQKSFLGQN
jgi:hypothetical protein